MRRRLLNEEEQNIGFLFLW